MTFLGNCSDGPCSCCCAAAALVDPSDGSTVIVEICSDATTYYQSDGVTPWAGDPDTLESAAGDPWIVDGDNGTAFEVPGGNTLPIITVPGGPLSTTAADPSLTIEFDISSLPSPTPTDDDAIYLFDASTGLHSQTTLAALGAVLDTPETLTTLALNGCLLTYTDEDGATTTLDLAACVQAAETVTTMVRNGDGTYTYVSESGVSTDIDIPLDETTTTLTDNGDGSFTYTSESGTVTTIPAPDPETITTMVINVDGSATYTSEDGTVSTIQSPIVAETITTLADNGDGSLTYTNENGATTTFVEHVDETITTLVANPDGSFTYTSESGVSTVLPAEVVTSLVDNGDGSYTYTNEIGTTTVIAVPAGTITTLVDNPDGSHTYTSEDGTITTIAAPDPETITTLVNNGDGSFTYTNESGVVTVIPAGATETVTSLGLAGCTLTYNDELGTATPLDLTACITALVPDETLTSISYDGATGTLSYVDEDGVTTDMVLPAANFLDNVIYDPVAQTVTFILSDGTTVGPIPLSDLIDPETVTTLTLAGCVLTYTNEDGVVATHDLTACIQSAETTTTLVVNPDGSYTYTNEDGVATTIPGESITTLVNNPDGSFTYTDETGVTVTVPAPPVETITTLVTNGDGSHTYTSEDGTITTIPVNPGETTSTLVQQPDGSFIYTDETGSTTTIPAIGAQVLTTLALAGCVLTYTDEDLATTTLDLSTCVAAGETLTSLSYNPATTSLTYNDENGDASVVSLADLVETTTTLGLSGCTLTYVDEDGATTALDLTACIQAAETVTTLNDNGDGTYTHTNEAGTVTTIDTSQDNFLQSAVFDPVTNTLTFTLVDGSTVGPIDLTDLVDAETITTLVDNGNGSFTYTSENGTTTTIPASTDVVTSLSLAGCTLSYVDENGSTTSLSLTACVQAAETTTTLVQQPDGSFIYTNEDGATTTIPAGSTETITTLALAGCTLSYVNEAGATTALDLSSCVDTAETLTTLTYSDAANALTYTDENGTANTISLSDLVETVTTLGLAGCLLSYVDENGATTTLDLAACVQAAETVTTLTANGDGSLTYVNEDGTATTVPNLVTGGSFDQSTGIATLLFSDGSSVTIPGFCTCDGEPPTAVAGADDTIIIGQSVTLDGTASFDGDGTIVSYLWTSPTGPTFTSATATTSALPIGTHVYTLMVTDDDGLTDTDTKVVTVVAVPTLTVTKSEASTTAPYEAGDTVLYSITVTNNSTSIPATGVTISEILDVTYSSGAEELLTVGEVIAPSSSLNVVVAHVVTAAEVAAGNTLTNTTTTSNSSGHTNDSDSMLVNLQATATQCALESSFATSGPSNGQVGDSYDTTVSITAAGSGGPQLTGVTTTITDRTIGDDYLVVSDPDNILCQPTTLDCGQTRSATIRTVVTCDDVFDSGFHIVDFDTTADDGQTTSTGPLLAVGFPLNQSQWVDPSIGNDGNAGTQASPKATIQAAINAIPDGGGGGNFQNSIVLAGRNQATHTASTGGTSGDGFSMSGRNNLEFIPWPGQGRPLLQHASTSAFPAAGRMSGCRRITFKCLEVSGASQSGTVDGWGLLGANASTDITFYDIIAHDFTLTGLGTNVDGAAITDRGANGVSFIKCETYANGAGSFFGGSGMSVFLISSVNAADFNGVLVDCCYSHENTTPNSIDGSGFIMDHAGSGTGTQAPSAAYTGTITVRRSVFARNYSQGINVIAQNGGSCFIQYNTSFDNSQDPSNPGAPSDQFRFAGANAGGGFTAPLAGGVSLDVRGNVFHVAANATGWKNDLHGIPVATTWASNGRFPATAVWDNTSGTDITADPQLINPTVPSDVNNYRLQSTSPVACLQSPPDPTSAGIDFTKLTEPASPPSWGAFEQCVDSCI